MGASRRSTADMALAVAKRALQAAKRVGDERELKVAEASLTNLPLGNSAAGWVGATGDVIGSGGAVLPLCQIVQGVTAENSRIGEEIVVKQIEVRGQWTTDATIGTANLRMIVFRDKLQRALGGVVPLPSEVLQLLRTNSMLYTENVDRWEIYVDQQFEMAKPSAASYTSRGNFSFYKKVNVPVKWQTSASNIIDKNGLYVLLLADHYTSGSDLSQQFTAATTEGLIDIQGRVYFTDA